MKTNEIHVGEHYVANVRGCRNSIVRIDAVRERSFSTVTGRRGPVRYEGTNLSTGRKLGQFTAARLRRKASDAEVSSAKAAYASRKRTFPTIVSADTPARATPSITTDAGVTTAIVDFVYQCGCHHGGTTTHCPQHGAPCERRVVRCRRCGTECEYADQAPQPFVGFRCMNGACDVWNNMPLTEQLRDNPVAQANQASWAGAMPTKNMAAEYMRNNPPPSPVVAADPAGAMALALSPTLRNVNAGRAKEIVYKILCDTHGDGMAIENLKEIAARIVDALR